MPTDGQNLCLSCDGTLFGQIQVDATEPVEAFRAAGVLAALLLAGCALALVPASTATSGPSPGPAPPIFPRIIVEVHGPHHGSYADPYAFKPNLDRLAAEGARFTRAFAMAPVCTPTRSAIITGMYPTSIGSHHMDGRGAVALPSPPHPEHRSVRVVIATSPATVVPRRSGAGPRRVEHARQARPAVPWVPVRQSEGRPAPRHDTAGSPTACAPPSATPRARSGADPTPPIMASRAGPESFEAHNPS